MILKFKVQGSIFINFFKREENRKHRKTLIHVYTSCKQTPPLIDTEKMFSFRSGIYICVTELYKSKFSVVCDFHFPRIFCFLNPLRLACSDNIHLPKVPTTSVVICNLSMMRFVYFTMNKNTKRSIQLSLMHALVQLKLAQSVHFCDEFFMGGVNMKKSNLDALFCQI